MITRIFLTTLLCQLGFAGLFAQTTQQSVQFPNHEQIMKVDVLQGQSSSETITPTSEKLCFDKIIRVKTVTSRGLAEACLFINTKIGLIAHSPVKRGSAGSCDIKPDLSEFSLFVVGLKGNTYHYFNTKKEGRIDHWVSTGNSDHALLRFASAAAPVPLTRKEETRVYCNDKAKAMLYKVDGRPEEWFLYGKEYPENITMAANKFLGNYGVGYQYSDKGLFIIMQMTGSGIDSKIEEIQDVQICFNPAGFKVYENEQMQQSEQQLEREYERLDRTAAREANRPCYPLVTEQLNFQRMALDRKREDLQQAARENVYQGSVSAQKARADAFINYDDVIQTSILETKVKICRQEEQLARAGGGNGSQSYRRMQDKLTCLQQSLVTQQQVQQQMREIDRQFANEPGRAFQEKARIFMRGISVCN